jgi:hypothetical protein
VCQREVAQTQLIVNSAPNGNAFEALCALASDEKWCWKIGCGTCGHTHFRYGFKELAMGRHPGSCEWETHNGVGPIGRGLGPPPPQDWTVESQRQLAKIGADASLGTIHTVCLFPDWLGCVGLLLHYTAPAEREEPILTLSLLNQLSTLVQKGSRSGWWLESRPGSYRLNWRDLEMFESDIGNGPILGVHTLRI